MKKDNEKVLCGRSAFIEGLPEMRTTSLTETLRGLCAGKADTVG